MHKFEVCGLTDAYLKLLAQDKDCRLSLIDIQCPVGMA